MVILVAKICPGVLGVELPADDGLGGVGFFTQRLGSEPQCLLVVESLLLGGAG